MRKVSDRHRQWLMREIPLLENEGVLSPETAGRIRTHYETHTQRGVHWMVVVFSILSAVLIGSGIILLFAHNWEDLTRPVRAVLSFCPLAVGALLSILALTRNGGVGMRESAGIFHALMVGATISLIGQTYHLPSNVPGFLLTWALLALPLMFLLRSAGVYLIYLALACGWSVTAQQTYGHAAAFWLLIIPPMVWLVRRAKLTLNHPETSVGFAGMIIALCWSLGMAMEHTVPGLWIIAYSSLLGGFGLLGIHLYGDRQGWSNVPNTLGVIGIVLLTYILTWEVVWDEIGWRHAVFDHGNQVWEIWLEGGITTACITLWIAALARAYRRNSVETVTLGLFPAVACVCFMIGSLAEETGLINALIFNLFMLFLGIMYVVLGCRNERFRQLNGGMATLSLLLITRFFDAEFGYLARGIVFIVLGAVFLVANLVMVRRKNRKEITA